MPTADHVGTAGLSGQARGWLTTAAAPGRTSLRLPAHVPGAGDAVHCCPMGSPGLDRRGSVRAAGATCLARAGCRVRRWSVRGRGGMAGSEVPGYRPATDLSRYSATSRGGVAALGQRRSEPDTATAHSRTCQRWAGTRTHRAEARRFLNGCTTGVLKASRLRPTCLNYSR